MEQLRPAVRRRHRPEALWPRLRSALFAVVLLAILIAVSARI